MHLHVEETQLSQSAAQATNNDAEHFILCFTLKIMLIIEASIFHMLAMNQEFGN